MLFEIKSSAVSHAIFQGLGQLHIYEKLLSARFVRHRCRKELVVPEGVKKALEEPLNALQIEVLGYTASPGRVTFRTRDIDAAAR